MTDIMSQPLNVLIVEDNPVDQKMLSGMLQESPGQDSLLKVTDSLEQCLQLLKEYHFDIVLLDLNLTDSNGEESLMKIYAHHPGIAVVINTGAYEEELGLKTLRLGAQDFLVKGKYNAYTLKKALRYAVERKQLENELLKAHQKLKESHSHIVQIEKMKLVGDLASGVAHEVKNPLSTVLYGVNYLFEHVQINDQNVDTVLKTIREAAEKASGIITDMLDFSCIDQLYMQPAALNEMIEKSLSLAHHKLVGNHIQVVKELTSDLPMIRADVNKIEQVILNLIFNAIDSMKDGGSVSIRSVYYPTMADFRENIFIDTISLEEPVVALEIVDQGKGINEDILERMFHPFVTTKRSDGGTGLGLFVSQNIMHNHHGEILVENNKDSGVKATLIFKVNTKQQEQGDSLT